MVGVTGITPVVSKSSTTSVSRPAGTVLVISVRCRELPRSASDPEAASVSRSRLRYATLYPRTSPALHSRRGKRTTCGVGVAAAVGACTFVVASGSDLPAHPVLHTQTASTPTKTRLEGAIVRSGATVVGTGSSKVGIRSQPTVPPTCVGDQRSGRRRSRLRPRVTQKFASARDGSARHAEDEVSRGIRMDAHEGASYSRAASILVSASQFSTSSRAACVRCAGTVIRCRHPPSPVRSKRPHERIAPSASRSRTSPRATPS